MSKNDHRDFIQGKKKHVNVFRGQLYKKTVS